MVCCKQKLVTPRAVLFVDDTANVNQDTINELAKEAGITTEGDEDEVVVAQGSVGTYQHV